MEDPTQGTAPASRSWRGRVVRWAILLAALAALAGIVYSAVTFVYQPQQRKGRYLDVGAQPVGVATVGRGDIRITRNAMGTVTPLATVTVRTQISGQLVRLGFEEGQMVRRGQVLAQIDPRPYEVALRQYQAQLARDEAALKQAQMDLARYELLLRQASIARQTAEDQAWIVRQDEATVRADQAQIDAQKLNLAYCRILAPIDGRVGLRVVDPGNFVQTSDANGLVVITQLQPTSVLFSIPEDDLPQLLARVQSGAMLPVSAYDRANQKLLATGEVSAHDNQVDTTTGVVRLRARFANADRALFPSQFVNVSLLLDTLHAVLTMPSTAVQRGTASTYVYLVNPDSTVSVRPVQLGAQDGAMVTVESGLAAGDRVVTDGADRLREGARVTIPGNVPPAAGANRHGSGRHGGQGGPHPGGEERRHHRRDAQQAPGAGQ